ncbi:MAG: hypothetical protein KGP27_08860 [Hyphomicrobiales bacterium]|nr:hypothetical protein [Hyphomicrobiales bacterium]
MARSFKSGWIAQLLAFLSLYLMYAAINELIGYNGPIGGRWELALPAFVGSLVLGGIAIWLKTRAAAEGERRRTEIAEAHFLDTIRGLAQGDAPPFTLYLRPFKLTNQLTYSTPEGHRVLRSVLVDEEKDIERYLAEAVEATAPLIGLGRPGEHHGAGRIAVPNELWRDAVMVLAHAAERIVLMPYPTDGTLWEVEHMFDAALIDKVVFVMPRSEELDVDVRAYWQACAEILRTRHGIELPPWTSEGALFSLTSDGRVGTTAPLHLEVPSRLREALERLSALSSRPLSPELAQSAQRLATAFKAAVERREAADAANETDAAFDAYPATTRDLSRSPNAIVIVAIAVISILLGGGPAILPDRPARTLPSAMPDEPEPEPVGA